MLQQQQKKWKTILSSWMTEKQWEQIAFLPKFSKHSKKHSHNFSLNLIFSIRTSPDACKITKVIPLHKNDNYLECNDYRPISLWSDIWKIIEKRLHKKLYSFLEHNKCICSLQFGFRPIHSTNHALISITEEIKIALDKK